MHCQLAGEQMNKKKEIYARTHIYAVHTTMLMVSAQKKASAQLDLTPKNVQKRGNFESADLKTFRWNTQSA